MAATSPYIECPNCGYNNPSTARICENCKSVLVEPTPPPSQVGAIRPPRAVPPSQVELQAPPVRPVIRVVSPNDPVLLPATLAEKRRETHSEFWEDPKFLMTAFLFVALVGKRLGLFGSSPDDDSASRKERSYSEEEAGTRKQEPYSTKSYEDTGFRKQKPYSKH